MRMFARPSAVLTRVCVLGAVLTSLFVLYCLDIHPISTLSLTFPLTFETTHATCPPRLWADGSWTRKRGADDLMARTLATAEDAVELYGFEGCAADREYFWHLGSDHEEQWKRFPNIASYEWTPGDGCVMDPFSKEGLVKHLVEDGGWLLVGDSTTEGHFFSLSCTLSPYVRATPNYTENPYYDRAWEQNLYLKPEALEPGSALNKRLNLRLPTGFNVDETPLVTFRRVDLLLGTPDLINIFNQSHPAAAESDISLFSSEDHWEQPISAYMPLFLHLRRYSTMVVSTGGHWTTSLLAGLRDEHAEYDGIGNVIDFFGVAMQEWATRVQEYIHRANILRLPLHRNVRMKEHRKPRVIVRAYLPGHEDCHTEEVWESGPVEEVKPFAWHWWNWSEIKDLNAVFENVLSSSDFPDVHFLPIDRPGLLRPDAHAAGDCLHLLAGPGVMEGWTEYIWHYVTNEAA